MPTISELPVAADLNSADVVVVAQNTDGVSRKTSLLTLAEFMSGFSESGLDYTPINKAGDIFTGTPTFAGAADYSGAISFTGGGIKFGAQTGSSSVDISKHIQLHSSGYGFGITGLRQNYVVPNGAGHYIIVNGTDVASFTATAAVIVPNTTISGSLTVSNGAGFGSQTGGSVTDLSKHIALYSTTYGLNITSNRLNYNVPTSARHSFLVNGTETLSSSATVAAVTGNLTVSGTAAITGTTTLTGDVTAAGAMTLTATTAIGLPVGTLAQRPSNVLGRFRYDSTNTNLEFATGSYWVPVPIRLAHVSDMTALKAFDITSMGDFARSITMSTRDGVPGYGAGQWDYYPTLTALPDDVITVRPNSISGANPGRWVRRLDANTIPAEAAGARGDYVFPTAGVGEVTGLDNTSAFVALTNAASTLSTTKRMGTVKIGPGCYRVTGNFDVPPGVKIEGTGGSFSGGPGNSRFDSGTVIVLDGSAALIQLQEGSWLSNIKVIRRGLDKNPSSGDVNTYWAARVSAMAGGLPWTAAQVVSIGDIRVNLNNVYKYDTAGTCGATNTGGPLEQLTTASAITDGTAACHFMNELGWSRSKPYTLGTVVSNGRHIYQCDQTGTSASTGIGPGGTTTGTGSITDGTCTWHWIASYHIAIRPNSFCRISDASIIGFDKGIEIKEGLSCANVTLDCLHGIDMQFAGDATQWSNVRMRQIYHVSGATQRRHGVGFFAHDRVDGLQMLNCGSQLWAIGACLSNMWPWMTDCYFESAATTRGDRGIELRNCIQGGLLSNNYSLAYVAVNIEATTSARAPSPPISGVVSAGINIQGGWYGSYPTGGDSDPNWTPCHFRIAGATYGQIRGAMINGQGRVPFQCYAVSSPSNDVFWTISDCKVEEAAVSDFNLDDLATIDSSIASFVHFDNCWHSTTNRMIVPPGHDATIDFVTTPTNGGSRTIPNGKSMVRLNHAATIAGYTITYPSEPLDGQRLSISAKSIVTTLTQTGGGSDTIESAETTIAAGQTYRRRYVKSITTWVKD